MLITDDTWINYWSIEPYQRIAPGVEIPGCGNTGEPYASVRMATAAGAIGTHFKEDLIALDYGCGGGVFCNFLSAHIENFKYYGLEAKDNKPRGVYINSPYPFTDTLIDICNNTYGHDPRVKFGFINEPIEQEALDTAMIVVANGVFTELVFQEVEWILNKMLPILSRNGIIVFSLFLGKTEYDHRPVVNKLGEYSVYASERSCIDQYLNYASIHNLLLKTHGQSDGQTYCSLEKA